MNEMIQMFHGIEEAVQWFEQFCGVISTAFLVASLFWVVRHASRPHPTVRCRLRWGLFVLANMLVILASMRYLQLHWGDPVEWTSCVIRTGLAAIVLMLFTQRKQHVRAG